MDVNYMDSKEKELKMKEKRDFDRGVSIRVRDIRDQAGLTQEKFAELLDVRPQYISGVERCESGLSTLVAAKMSDRFCISCDYILKGDQIINDISPIVDKLKYLDKEELKYIERYIMEGIELIAFEKSRKANKQEK